MRRASSDSSRGKSSNNVGQPTAKRAEGSGLTDGIRASETRPDTAGNDAPSR
jgi:hypothetical protein